MKVKTILKVKKLLVTLLIAVFTLVQTPLAIAETLPPSAPEVPTAPSTPENTYVAPTPPSAPEAPTAPTAPEPASLDSSTNEPVTQTDTENPTGTSGDIQGTTDALYSDDAGTKALGGVGDTTVVSGDANNVANISTSANNNLAVSGGLGSGSITVANTGNGDQSTNSGSASVTNTDNTDQLNSAQVVNDLDQNTISGHNSASFNTGGDSIVVSGNSNTSGTVITAVNTNVDGVAVAEFNIVDDHVGDIILDFGSACISGCGGTGVNVVNADNGTYSDNNAQAYVTNTDNTNQVNDAAVTSNLDLSSDSGNNDASFNADGDSTITTGDANVSANALTFANNNLTGNVIYGVVNIYGNLVGDIILTEAALNAFCGNCLGSTSVSNTGNGANSTNDATVNQTANSDTNQYNNADIQNNLILTADTGDNSTSANVGGDSTIMTGDANILANVVNIANMNIVGGNWWLVIVNEAGNWIGKLIGFGDSNMAGSEEIDFTVGADGQVYVSNSDNGVGSTNNTKANVNNSSNVNQDNNAVIENNINLSANTGGNTSSFNTGGDSTIVTGDANIIANIINFVNNNIVGTGNLFVTVINVFGSWVGDFIGPGQTKEVTAHETGIGGSQQEFEGTQSNSPENQNQDTSEQFQAQTVLAANTSKNELSEKIAGLFAGNKVENDTDDKLAFAGSEVTSGTASDKILNINLAYLLLLLPAYGLFLIAKKYSYLILPRRVGNAQ
jgi:hypothetical protein